MAVENWMLVRIKPNRHAWAAENIRRQGFEYYCPHITKVIRRPQKMMVSTPLFEGYGFVAYVDNWHSLLGTFGVAGLVLNGDRPALLPGAEIAKLRSREDDEGIVVLPTSPFKKGGLVEITDGPLVGKQGICDGMTKHSRIQVLMDYLGGKTKVLVAESQLCPVD